MVTFSPDHRGTGLIDILDKVLDKGLVVAGDIQVSLANVELLTIRLRLIVCSVDKAQEIGLDWWRHDRYLTHGANNEVAALSARIQQLEKQVAALPARLDGDGGVEPRKPTARRSNVARRRRARKETSG
ncbi:MAG: gas vesicle protein [Chloroflexi bacterium]|nr:gas vesicle protein [Chloroflexota bacterium]